MSETAEGKKKKRKLKSQNYIEVELNGAKNLLSYDTFSSTSDPYVKISLKKDEEKLDDCAKSYSSSTKLKTLNPEWDESFLFKQEGEKELVFQIFDHNKIGDDELMSTLVIPVSEISVEEQEEPKEFAIVDRKKKKDVGSKLLLTLERHLDIKLMKGRARKMREDKEKAEEKAAQLEAEKSVDAKQIEDLQAQLKALQDDLEAERENLKNASERAENAETSLQKAESDLEKATADSGEVESSLTEENETLKASLTDLTAELEAVKSEAKHQQIEAEEESQEPVEPQSSVEESERLYNSQDSEELGALRSENEALKHRVTQLSGELEKWIAGRGDVVSEQKSSDQTDEAQAKEIQKLLENIKTLTTAKEKLEKQLAESGNAPAKSSKLRWVIGSVVVLINVLVITLYFVRRKRAAAS